MLFKLDHFNHTGLFLFIYFLVPLYFDSPL